MIAQRPGSFVTTYRDSYEVRDAANHVPYVSQTVLTACALFEFLNGCDVRWTDGPEDFSIASFADDCREVEGFAWLTRRGLMAVCTLRDDYVKVVQRLPVRIR